MTDKHLIQVQGYTDKGEAMIGLSAVNPHYIWSIVPNRPGFVTLLFSNETHMVVEDKDFYALCERRSSEPSTSSDTVP